MKPKIAVLLLAVLLCLTTGCNNALHIAETPDPISSSDSNIVPSESETAQAKKKTEVDRPQSTESQTDSRAAEFPASVSESDTQTTEVPDQADHSTAVLPQPSEPEKKTDESERRPETAAPTEKEQPTPPATEESTPPAPPKEEPTCLSCFSAKICARYLQSLTETRTSFTSVCGEMMFTALRTARPSATTLNAASPILQKPYFGSAFRSSSWKKRLRCLPLFNKAV